MRILFILNEPPYGTEHCYNALRLAHALLRDDAGTEISVFLMADAAAAARKDQKTPDGYYNLERMLKRIARVLVCGTCMNARGITDADLMQGAQRSDMNELARQTAAADKVLVF